VREDQQRDIVKSFLTALWALGTVVLLFCVFLLANELIKIGEDPVEAILPSPRSAPESVALERPTHTLGAKDVALYFASPDGRDLMPETQSIDYSDSTVENCRIALERLIAGPREALTPILPSNTRIRAIYLLENGELVVDLSRELISEYTRIRSASLESLLVYGVINTLAQPALAGKNEPAIRSVRLLLEGQAPQEAFPAHLNLSTPLEPDRSRIVSGFERRGDA